MKTLLGRSLRWQDQKQRTVFATMPTSLNRVEDEVHTCLDRRNISRLEQAMIMRSGSIEVGSVIGIMPSQSRVAEQS